LAHARAPCAASPPRSASPCCWARRLCAPRRNAFRLANGRTVSVERDWPAAGAESAFLRRVRDDACKVFGSVLSPDDNAAHHNHLHLEHGGRGPCG
jgi:hypothetical protein